MHKKLISILLGTVFAFFVLNNIAISQTISEKIFGQNAWMPYEIGSVKYYGQLHNKWGEIQKSGASVIRYGGIAPDKNNPTKAQYIQMIDSIRARGMEPIMQVSFNNWQYSAGQAADIVKYVNITMNRNIKYWIIGNEPDHVYGFTSSSQVAPYLKSFASAMKYVDPSIKTIGPECAWYNSGIINGLTSPGGPDDVTGKNSKGFYYMDYISFHTYPFNGSQDRASVISYLTQSGKFDDKLKELNTRLANCNNHHGRSGSDAVKVAITEANINYQNSSSDGIYGTGAMSFLGGQFWAEMLAISLKNNVEIFNFWSVVEGNNTALNIGYIDKFSGRTQPTYHHFKMMAENFSGTYIDGSDNQDKIKAFGSKDNSKVSVMILNQSSSTNHTYTLRLNGTAASAGSTANVNINAGIDKEYSGTIDNQSTTLLVFDLAGNILKKCEYKIGEHANNNLPPSCTDYGVVPPPTELSVTISSEGSTTFCSGGSVTLKSEPITGATYQWKKDGVNIPGANTYNYVASTSGSFTLDVSLDGLTSSSNAITVDASNGITATVTADGATEICSGGSVLLKSNTGTGFIYQWKKDGVAISGATQSTYSATAAGEYQVKITSGACVAWSAPVKVSINNNFLATVTAMGSTTFCAGGSVILKSNTGAGYIYQWKKDGAAILGANDSIYKATSAGDYQVKIISGSCVAWSAPVKVSIGNNLNAEISGDGPTTFCDGGYVILNANSGGVYAYQWKKNGNNISGATGQTYKATSAGKYNVKVMQGSCVDWSSEIKVSITKNFKASITASGSTTFKQGQSVTLKSNTGSGFIYQWKKDGEAINGATESTYLATQSGEYQVKITNGTCTAWSAPLKVTVYTAKLVSGEDEIINKSSIAKSASPIQSNEGEDNIPNMEEGTATIKAYPNPTKGPISIEVELPGYSGNEVFVEIINSLGQAIYQKAITYDGSPLKDSFGFESHHAAGMYFVRVMYGEKVHTEKILLNK